MSEADETTGSEESPQPAPESREPGVFGKLPRSRPGLRSPLRESRGRKRAEREPAAAEEPQAEPSAAEPPEPDPLEPPASSPPHPRGAPPRAAEPQLETDPEAGHGAGLEDLAWAGITVAAEAATLGVRLASRALEAVREAVERR